jgi:ribonuclease BN (tRNA processing enzyme)
MKIRNMGEEGVLLTNGGQLSLIFIGVGSAFAKRNFQTNLLIIKGEDHLQIDSGTRCSMALMEMGLSVTKIKNYYITHSHADHIGGLEEIGLMGRYVTKSCPRIFITPEYQKILWDMSLQGGSKFSEKNNGNFLSFEDFFEIERPVKLDGFSRDVYEFNAGSINIKSMRTMHIPEDAESWKDSFWSAGVIIDNRVMFSGDTRFDKNLILEFDGVFNFELIIHDVQFFTGGVHASIDELNTFPDNIKSKMLLVHYGDNWEKFDDKVREYGFMGFLSPKTFYDFD